MTAAPPLLLELLDPRHRADPYPIYRRLREGGPMLLPESNLAVQTGLERRRSFIFQRALRQTQAALFMWLMISITQYARFYQMARSQPLLERPVPPGP